MNPFQVVRDFEKAVGEYTGAPYVVAVNSCTNALFLCLMWFKHRDLWSDEIEIPARTYVSVPMQIMHAGARVMFRDEEWSGVYRLEPFPLWDAARRFTSGMYKSGQFMCTSHHWSKTLGIQQGGCILHDDPFADVWLRKARFDGRTEGAAPKDDDFILGWHCYMSPEVAAEGVVRLCHLPRHNADLPNSDYPDLSQIPLFGGGRSARAIPPMWLQNYQGITTEYLRQLSSLSAQRNLPEPMR